MPASNGQHPSELGATDVDLDHFRVQRHRAPAAPAQVDAEPGPGQDDEVGALPRPSARRARGPANRRPGGRRASRRRSSPGGTPARPRARRARCWGRYPAARRPRPRPDAVPRAATPPPRARARTAGGSRPHPPPAPARAARPRGRRAAPVRTPRSVRCARPARPAAGPPRPGRPGAPTWSPGGPSRSGRGGPAVPGRTAGPDRGDRRVALFLAGPGAGVVPGAVLFGTGWAISGGCPAIPIAQVASGYLPAVVTIGGIVGARPPAAGCGQRAARVRSTQSSIRSHHV